MTVQISEEIVPQIGSTNYTLTCILSGAEGHPANNTTFQWFKDVNGTRVQVGSNTSILSFSQPLKLSSAGHYTCDVSRVYNSLSVLAKAEASWDVKIQSKFFLLLLLLHHLVNYTISPGLVIELNMTSDPSSPIRPIGSHVSLNCSCDIVPNLPAEYIDISVTVSISLRDPSGTLLSATVPLVSGSVYTSSAVISSFGQDHSGIYNCTASVRASSSFVIGREISIQKRVTTGNKIPSLF